MFLKKKGLPEFRYTVISVSAAVLLCCGDVQKPLVLQILKAFLKFYIPKFAGHTISIAKWGSITMYVNIMHKRCASEICIHVLIKAYFFCGIWACLYGLLFWKATCRPIGQETSRVHDVNTYHLGNLR